MIAIIESVKTGKAKGQVKFTLLNGTTIVAKSASPISTKEEALQILSTNFPTFEVKDSSTVFNTSYIVVE